MLLTFERLLILPRDCLALPHNSLKMILIIQLYLIRMMILISHFSNHKLCKQEMYHQTHSAN